MSKYSTSYNPKKEQAEGSYQGERAKLSFLSLLLLLILVILVFSALSTFQAVQNFQQQYSSVKAGDVKAIHPWMTIHVISHVCHVPENYLYHSLNIDNSESFRHATLYEIADRKRQPVSQVIHSLQKAILTYRKKHPAVATPGSIQRLSRKPPAHPIRRSDY